MIDEFREIVCPFLTYAFLVKEVNALDTIEIIWAVLIIVFLIVEGVTAGLASIWFAAGAVAGLVLALLNVPFGWQITAFIIVSVITLILTRPLARKYVNRNVQPTNADRAIGQTGIVLEEIDNIAGTGAIRINGKIWTARSVNGDVIAKGVLVTAVAIIGVTIQVKPSIDTDVKSHSHVTSSGDGEE